jgi:hypothetical protein
MMVSEVFLSASALMLQRFDVYVRSVCLCLVLTWSEKPATSETSQC